MQIFDMIRLLLTYLMFTTLYSANSQNIVLYEGRNYVGQPKAFPAGLYTLEDFNDIASSVKVPAGMVVVLYEYAAVGKKGYGIYVDLLEDCPDLSVYDFNNKVSFISVFKVNNDNLTWVRNSIVNGQFVSGHWVRQGLRSSPSGAMAVVGLSLPGPAPATGQTRLSVNGAITSVNELGPQTLVDKSVWQMAMTDQLGVIGNDFRGVEEIGTACFERASNVSYLPDNLNFWYPQKIPNDHRSVAYFKRTLNGTLKHTEIAQLDGVFEDYDLNLDIVPASKYQYLISQGHPYEYTNIMSTEWTGSFHQHGQPDCDHEDKSIVECEIDSDPAAKNYIFSSLNNSTGKSVCLYGVWCYDQGHCCHPEIHPAEQIWWSDVRGNGKQYFFSVMCDASKRFWWRNEMDDGSKLKPWGAPPIKGLFAIAFETSVNQPKKFEVSNINHFNVIKYANADKTYNLVYNNKILLSFVPHNDAFKVSFSNVGSVEGSPNTVRGFLVIETSVGTCTQISTDIPPNTDPNSVNQDDEESYFRKVAGHYLFNVTESILPFKQTKALGNNY